MFNDVLLQLRKDNKMSQKDLADKLGISRSTVSMYELGQREPDIEMLEAIADTFNVDMDYLLGKSKIKRTVNLDYLRNEHGYMLGKIAKMNKPIDIEFLTLYEKLSDEQKRALLSIAKQLVKE